MHSQAAETPALLQQQQQLLFSPTSPQLTQPAWIQPREDIRLENQTLGFRSKSAFSFFRLENVQFHFRCKCAQSSLLVDTVRETESLCIKLLILQTLIHFAIHQLNTKIYVHALEIYACTP